MILKRARVYPIVMFIAGSMESRSRREPSSYNNSFSKQRPLGWSLYTLESAMVD